MRTEMTRESVTLRRTHRAVWMRRYDDYEESFTRISRNEALESISNARQRGDMFSDANENSENYQVFGYWN